MNERFDIIAQAPRVANAVADWASARADIRGLAIIGSHARGEARPDSDIDLTAIALDPKTLKADTAWPDAIAWPGMRLINWRDERYGVVWSRRLRFEPSCEVELSFGPLSWAALNPIDLGTRHIVLDGFRVLYDPDGLMTRLCAACQS
jgi:uncharacterized protein